MVVAWVVLQAWVAAEWVAVAWVALLEWVEAWAVVWVVIRVDAITTSKSGSDVCCRTFAR